MNKIESLNLRKEVFEKERDVLCKKLYIFEKNAIDQTNKEVTKSLDVGAKNVRVNMSLGNITVVLFSRKIGENQYDNEANIYLHRSWSEKKKIEDSPLELNWFSTREDEKNERECLDYLMMLGKLAEILKNGKHPLKSILIKGYNNVFGGEIKELRSKKHELEKAINEIDIEIQKIKNDEMINFFKEGDKIYFNASWVSCYKIGRGIYKYVEIKKITDKKVTILCGRTKYDDESYYDKRSISKEELIEFYHLINTYKYDKDYRDNGKIIYSKYLRAKLNENVLEKDPEVIEVKKEEYENKK